MPALKISEALIRQNATDKSFQRGKEYARSQSVRDLIWRDQTLQASVAGNEYYRVSIGFNKQEVQSPNCSCPYNFEGWCKHIVATLLVGMEQPNIEERPSLAQLLERIDLEQTRNLLQTLVAKTPDLIDLIDLEIELLTVSKSAVSKSSQISPSSFQRAEINRSTFRRPVRYLLREALRDIEFSYEEEDPFSNLLDDEIAKTKQFIEAGDSFRAFVMLYAIAEELSASEYVDEIEEYGGAVGDLVDGLDLAMAEAILWTDFTIAERQKWITEIENTQVSLGVEFELSLLALAQGWDAQHLQLILRGEYTYNLTDEQIDSLKNDIYELSHLRLSILAAQERFDEYLNFARAYEFVSHYVNMLIQMGRLDEAIAAAENVQDERDAFDVAKKLLEHGAEREALNIANKGLQLQEEDSKRYCSVDLADWTANLAERLGEHQICLNAKIISFKLKPALADYHKIRDLAKDKWNSVKKTLLEYLRTIDYFAVCEAKADIFLEEGMLNEAIAIADASYCQNPLRLRVMQAVVRFNPEWVISKSKALAEDIITRGKAEAYEQAIAWLDQVRKGYLARNQEKDWFIYRNQLVEANARKRKLMELLKYKGL